jgi:transcriptional regulator with XRE-family HTH domain
MARAAATLRAALLAAPLATQIAGADLHVGRRIREARIQRGLSLAELAAQLGVSTPQARKYEAGRNAIPATRLPALAAALGVDLGYFFEGLHDEQRVGPYRPHLPTRPRMLLDLVRASDALPDAGLAALCAAARAFAGDEAS